MQYCQRQIKVIFHRIGQQNYCTNPKTYNLAHILMYNSYYYLGLSQMPDMGADIYAQLKFHRNLSELKPHSHISLKPKNSAG